MLSQPSLNKASSHIGLSISLFLHAALVAWVFFKHPFLEIKPVEHKPIKISLNSFKPIAAPVFAPEPSPAPPTPPAPPPPEPTPPQPAKITPPQPEPKPQPKPDPKPKPVKKIEPKPQSKPEVAPPKPQPLPVEPQPMPPAIPAPTIATIAPATSASTGIPSSPTNTNKPGGAPNIGEFNMQNSVGDENFEQIRRAIKKHHKYPKNAVKMRKQGVVEMVFTLHTDGRVSGIKVSSSSGHEILDEAASETISSASKDFPKLTNDRAVRIPISYKL